MSRFRVITHIAYNSPKCKNFYLKAVDDNPVGVTSDLDIVESQQTSALRKSGLRGGYSNVPSIIHHFVRPFNPGIDEE